MFDLSGIPHPSHVGLDWGWCDYTGENAKEVLATASPELRNVLVNTMRQCWADHEWVPCKESCDGTELHVEEGTAYWFCMEHVEAGGHSQCCGQAEWIEDQSYWAHHIGSEDVQLVGIWLAMPDGSPDHWGYVLYVEMSYTSGLKQHSFGANYGVKPDGTASCTAD